VQAVQPSVTNPARNPLVANPEGDQLRPAHHPVLARGQTLNAPLGVPRGGLFVHLDG
jgi:hypothetical protein